MGPHYWERNYENGNDPDGLATKSYRIIVLWRIKRMSKGMLKSQSLKYQRHVRTVGHIFSWRLHIRKQFSLIHIVRENFISRTVIHRFLQSSCRIRPIFKNIILEREIGYFERFVITRFDCKTQKDDTLIEDYQTSSSRLTRVMWPSHVIPLWLATLSRFYVLGK